MITQIALLGDSIFDGDAGGFDIVEGGLGCFAELVAERLANIAGIGPLLSAGFRGVWRTPTGEWARTGTWTQNVSTDAFDKALHGQAWWSNSGSAHTTTYTVPASSRPIVGFAIEYIDTGGNWQYRIDGGTWTNHGQTIQNNNAYKRFYVASTVTSTVDFRAFDGASAAHILITGIEPFFVAPQGANGLIVHNLGSDGRKLHNAVLATSGDRLAWFDAVTLGTGSPIAHTPTATISMFINDVLDASTSAWDIDLSTLHARVPSLGLMSLYEADLSSYNQTQQTNYRAHTKTSAAGFSPAVPVLDLFDAYSALGLGVAGTQNAAMIAAGLTFAAGTHPSQAGHLDLADRVYWWVRNNFFHIGAAGAAFKVGKTQLGATSVLGGAAEAILPDGKAVSVVAGSPTVHATNTIVATGKAVVVTAGGATTHAVTTISPTGKAVTVGAGTPSIAAHATIAPSGKAIAVTAGGPVAIAGPGQIPTFGVAIVVGAGSPTILPGAVTIGLSGHAVTTAAGAATVHATKTITPSGKAIVVTAGGPTTASHATIHPSGVPVLIIAGTITFAGGVSEPASATLTVVGHPRATVAVIPGPTATVSV